MGGFVLLFLISIPLLILYSAGYRLNSALDLIRTGGMYVFVPYSGVEVSIGKSVVKETRVFSKNVFVQNLRPGSYDVKVEKAGYQSWYKQMRVFPQTVTEAHPFLIAEKPVLVEILPIITQTNSASSSSIKINSSLIKESNPEYDAVKKLFMATTTKFVTTSISNIKYKNKLQIQNNVSGLNIQWVGDIDSAPYFFCVNELCKNQIFLGTNSSVKYFDLFPGRDDIIILALKEGIFVSEITDSMPRNTQTIVKGTNLDFRVSDDGVVYIEDKEKFYSISF